MQRNQRSNSQHLLDHKKKARELQKNIYFCFIDYTEAFDCVDHNKLCKILKEIGIQDHLTCLLRNLYAGQEATVRTRHGTMNWFQIGKGVHQGCILSPCLFNLYAEYIVWNARLESRLLGEISTTSHIHGVTKSQTWLTDWTTTTLCLLSLSVLVYLWFISLEYLH